MKYKDRKNSDARNDQLIADLFESIGCGIVVTAVLSSGVFFAYKGIKAISEVATEQRAQAAKDAALERPVYQVKIVKKAQIPTDISERAKQEYPYWITVEHNDELWKLNFDTDDPFYDPSEEGKRPAGTAIKLEIGAKSGTSYRNKAISLDNMLEIGSTVHLKTREQIGVERDVYDILKIEAPK